MRTTRDAVVGAAEKIQLLRKKAIALARKAGNKWEDTKPQQQKAKEALKQAGRTIADFERDVREGLKQGIAEVKKRSRNGRK